MTTIPPLAHLLAVAEAAMTSPLSSKPWRVEPDGRTVWSGDWTKDGQQHPVCTYWVESDPNGTKAPPLGTNAIMQHIATFSPSVALALLARVRELEEGLKRIADCRDALDADDRYLPLGDCGIAAALRALVKP